VRPSIRSPFAKLRASYSSARVEAQERVMDRTLAPGERAALLDMLGRISRAFEP
jgi:hypothetical protein